MEIPLVSLASAEELDVGFTDEMELIFLTRQCNVAAVSAIQCYKHLVSINVKMKYQKLKKRFCRHFIIKNNVFKALRENGQLISDNLNEIASLAHKSTTISLNNGH